MPYSLQWGLDIFNCSEVQALREKKGIDAAVKFIPSSSNNSKANELTDDGDDLLNKEELVQMIRQLTSES